MIYTGPLASLVHILIFSEYYFNTQCQYSHVDNNQLTDQSINPVFYPCAQSNVQKSQCGSDNYMWQAHNMGHIALMF